MRAKRMVSHSYRWFKNNKTHVAAGTGAHEF